MENKTNDIYLIFYNCISLIYFPNSIIEKINNLYNSNYIDLGILITKYYQNGKEIILKTNIENNEKRFNIYGNNLTLERDNVEVFNGNKYNIILNYQINEINEKDNKLILYYQNQIKKI